MEFSVNVNTYDKIVNIDDIKEVINRAIDDVISKDIDISKITHMGCEYNCLSGSGENSKLMTVGININRKEEKDVDPLKAVKDPIYIPLGEQPWNQPWYMSVPTCTTNTKYSDESNVNLSKDATIPFVTGMTTSDDIENFNMPTKKPISEYTETKYSDGSIITTRINNDK